MYSFLYYLDNEIEVMWNYGYSLSEISWLLGVSYFYVVDVIEDYIYYGNY